MLKFNKSVIYLNMFYIFDKQKQTIMYNKSIIFRSAHAIFKMQNVTFSEALIEAWSKVKQGVKAIVMKCNRQIKSECWIGYETIYFNELFFQSIVVSRESVAYNPAIEKYYGFGMYNND